MTQDHASDAWGIAHQVAAVNAVLGLLLNERTDDPAIGSVVVECNLEGLRQVTLCDLSGTPVGGYTL